MQCKEGVASGFEIRSWIPIIETEDGTKAPLNSGSREKEIGLPATAIITSGSITVMVFEGPGHF